MQWYELGVKTTQTHVNAVMAMLLLEGSQGIKIDDPDDGDIENPETGGWDYYAPEMRALDFDGVLVTGYFECSASGRDALVARLKERYAEFSAPNESAETGIVMQAIFPEEWLNNWKRYFKPTRIGNHVVIKPSWEVFDAAAGDVVIEIDPGNAFGSGTHETTALCIELLERYIRPGNVVVDVGCGSGILSIAAGKLGARRVTGVDNDPAAVNTARENVEINGLSQCVHVALGDLLTAVESPADMIVANIVADVVIQLADPVRGLLKPGGYYVCSGILRSRLEAVQNALCASGFAVDEALERGEWAALIVHPAGFGTLGMDAGEGKLCSASF